MASITSLTTLASAKRGPKERSGVHLWHPYYAGYSEAFVDSAIKYLDLNRELILLDPWNGSGTTAFVASRFGIQTVGCEINPVMNIFSAAKSGFLLGQERLIKEILEDIKNQTLHSSLKICDQDPLLDFMSESLSACIRNLYKVIDFYKYPKYPLAAKLLKASTSKKSLLNPFEAFFKAALFIVARKLAGYKGGSNPTWVKTLTTKPEYHIQDVISQLDKVINFMIRELELSNIPLLDAVLHLPLEADSRNLCIRSQSIDGIITSPPYLTRIDYAMSTRPELLITSNPKTLRTIREETIGAPVIVDKSIEISSTWGETCLTLLEHVKSHKSKAAISYYLPNMLQYFRDIECSLREIIRVLKSKSQALVVVQSSFFKEHAVDLGQIYVELIRSLSAHCEIVSREVIRGHMAHANTRSNQYKKNKVYYEDVVCINRADSP